MMAHDCCIFAIMCHKNHEFMSSGNSDQMLYFGVDLSWIPGSECNQCMLFVGQVTV